MSGQDLTRTVHHSEKNEFCLAMRNCFNAQPLKNDNPTDAHLPNNIPPIKKFYPSEDDEWDCSP